MRRSPRVLWVENQVRSRYQGTRILDVGFVGSYKDPFLHLGIRQCNPRLVGIDIDKEGVLKWRLPDTLVGDGKKLPFRDNSFDVILCLEVLEHLYDPFCLFVETYRVLKPQGELLITTPNAYGWWNFLRNWMVGSSRTRTRREVYRRYLGDKDHKCFYDPLSLMNLLDDAGFETKVIATKNHAIPFVRRVSSLFDLLDWQFYPMNRLGHYLCLIATKAHQPKLS
jgi:SAM-dependent methyltransferase